MPPALIFETESHCVTQSGLWLMILLPQSPECWNYINFSLKKYFLSYFQQPLMICSRGMYNLALAFQKTNLMVLALPGYVGWQKK
jgi:hypothetical protein